MPLNDILAPGTTNALSEFFGFVGDCGQAAAQILVSAYNQVLPNPQNLNAQVNDMISRGLATSQGITSTQALQKELGIQGYNASIIDNWRMALSQVTQRPVELLLSNAQALPGDQGVLGHFVSAVGYSPSTGKFIVSDPNSVDAKQGKFSLFSAQQLAAAMPVNALVITNKIGAGPADVGPPNIQATQAKQAQQQGDTPLFSGVGAYTQDAISGALGQGFNDFLTQMFGVSNAKDAGIRVLLIIGALILLMFGILALILPKAQQEAPQAAQIAAVAA